MFGSLHLCTTFVYVYGTVRTVARVAQRVEYYGVCMVRTCIFMVFLSKTAITIKRTTTSSNFSEKFPVALNLYGNPIKNITVKKEGLAGFYA